MMDSKLQTLTVPAITTGNGTAADPAPPAIVQAQKTPLRVLIRNLSNGASVFLSFDASTLRQAVVPSGLSYELPSGAADAFMVAAGQKLYAVSASAGVKVSLAVSEALPIDKQP